ncbi:tyrosine-type recombinase/integrase [Bacillus marasmi]|uniref:tyrosine-type recombinase/integrase n=1 Tax=Bacillus marasmi TaxID=1926279 RepID=UPI0011C9E769|nr:tyrosine-type recombinase/integrase [Bacillus marasmi]
MKGHYKKRGCTCPIDNCTCGKTWSYTIDIGRNPKNGRRKQATRGRFKTKEEAQLAAAALLNEIKQGSYIKESNILFKDFAQEWLKTYSERTGCKPGTIRLRQYSINKLLPYFAHLKLKVITDDMYQAALNDLKQQGLSKSTMEGFHVTGKMIFKFALSKRMLKVNPTEFAYIPKDNKAIIESEEDECTVEDELPKYFEKEELAQFLDIVNEKGLYMDEPIFITLAYTGMRVGELVVLKWKDIDFNQRTISITKTYNNDKNNTKDYLLVAPKTISSKRKIFVDEIVIEALRKHKLQQEKFIKLFGKSYYDKGFIFANFNRHPGYPILTKLVRTRMTRLLKFLEFQSKKYNPHALRHTHTSLLAEAGVDIEEIMERLGHSDEKTTRKIYLHVTKVMKTEASDKFGKLMRGVIKKL